MTLFGLLIYVAKLPLEIHQLHFHTLEDTGYSLPVWWVRIVLRCFAFLLLFWRGSCWHLHCLCGRFPIDTRSLASFSVGVLIFSFIKDSSSANVFFPAFTLFFDFITCIPVELTKFCRVLSFVSSGFYLWY